MALHFQRGQRRKHPQHLRAVEMVLNRVGLHEKTQHQITVTREDITPEVIGRLAASLGVDPRVLLGLNTVPECKQIEAEAVPVEADGLE